MAEYDSMRIMVAKFYGKESESVTVEYAGQSYDVNPTGIITIHDRQSGINEVIGLDGDFREGLFQPILLAQATAVRLSLLEKLKDLNIQVINDVISKYDISLKNVTVDAVNNALAEVKTVVQPSLADSAFKLFGQKPSSSMLDRVYQALREINEIKTYPDLNSAMEKITGQPKEPPKMAVS